MTIATNGVVFSINTVASMRLRVVISGSLKRVNIQAMTKPVIVPENEGAATADST